MPWLVVYGVDGRAPLGEIIAALLAEGDRVVVEGGVVVSMPTRKRATNRARQQRYRDARRRDSNAPESVTRNAGEVENFDDRGSGYNPLSPSRGLEREGYPAERNASNARNGNADRNALRVTPHDDASAFALPPMSPEQRDANRAASAELRERMRKGEL